MIAALKIAGKRLLEWDIPVIAGGLAFFGVLSVFPSIGLALLLYSLFSTPDEAQLLADAIKHLVPHDAHRIISTEFRLLADWAAHHIGFGMALAVALVAWSAISGWKALISGVRLVTGEERRLTIVGYHFQSLVLSFVFVGAIAIGAMVFILLVRVLDFAPTVSVNGINISLVFKHFREELLIWMIASVGIYVSLLTIYRVTIPHGTASFPDCSKGAVAGAIAWFICIAVFDLYAEKASWRSIYGTLTGVIAILFWFYVSAYAALFGAAFAASLKRTRTHSLT